MHLSNILTMESENKNECDSVAVVGKSAKIAFQIEIKNECQVTNFTNA